MEIRQGTLQSFNAATYQATVQPLGSLTTWLEGVAVARNIPAAEMATGRRCAVLFFDPADLKDAVLFAVYQ